MTQELCDAPQNELFTYIVGDVGQFMPAFLAGRVCFCAGRTQKKSKILWFGRWGRGHFSVQNICLDIKLTSHESLLAGCHHLL